MRRILIFMKEPVAGCVKTRLAAEIGAEAACFVYRRCVTRTLEQMAALRDEVVLCVEPAQAAGRMQVWLGSSWPILPQRGATLGERLSDASGRAFREGAQRVLTIGADSPWLDEPLVEEAFSALGQADIVLGPAADGGYYLVGLAKPAPGLFDGISWGTSRVLEQTLERASALGKSAALLPVGYDVDRLSDLRRWMQEDSRHGLSVWLPMGGRPFKNEEARACLSSISKRGSTRPS